jgi:hypothetical protein
MADSNKHAALTAEIAKLHEEQLEDIRDATFMGWKPESSAAHDSRKRQIAELEGQLASLDETKS